MYMTNVIESVSHLPKPFWSTRDMPIYLTYETAFEVLCENTLSLLLFYTGEFKLFPLIAGLCLYRECNFRCSSGLLMDVSTHGRAVNAVAELGLLDCYCYWCVSLCVIFYQILSAIPLPWVFSVNTTIL
jgi:hypothetical protein